MFRRFEAFLAARQHFLSRTRLDRLTGSERLLLAGVITALVWGAVGVSREAAIRRRKRPSASPGLYRELMASLPPVSEALIRRSAPLSPPEGEVLETVPVKVYLTRPLDGPPPAAPAKFRFSRFRDHPGRININTASPAQLIDLPGIGPRLATRIIEYRKRHGGFGTISDLKKIKGIGEKRFQQLRDRVCLY